MEELRSTDILDKEIQSDARKKAARILLDADAECQNILSNVDVRLASAKNERQNFYNAKSSSYEKNVQAAIPLENQRFLVSYISSSVSDAINEYLKNLSESKRLELVLTLLDRSIKVISTKKMNAFVYGFKIDNVKSLLEKKLSSSLLSCKEVDLPPCTKMKNSGDELCEEILLEADDKSLRCRLTIEEIISEIKDKYNYELATTLFGGRLPE